MVAIVSGNGLGVVNSSASVLGANGVFGNSLNGSAREAAYVNLFNGNVVLQEKDEFLAARGVDSGLTRSYNSQGTLNTGLGWRQGPVRRLAFDGSPNRAGSKVVLSDADGTTSTYAYDGLRYASTDGGGAYRSIVYDADAQQWTWQDNHNDRAGLYEVFDSAGLLLNTCDLGGVIRSYEYKNILGQDLLSTVKNPASGDVTSYAYDGLGKLAEVSTVAGGKTVSRVNYSYTGSRLDSVMVDLTPEDSSDAVVYTTSYGYDAGNRINRINQTDGSVLGFEYDTSGRVSAYYDGSGRKTLISYAPGRTTVTDPSGVKTSYAYNAAGLLTEVLINDGGAAGSLRTRYFYDAQGDGNLESVIDARGIETKYTYDKNGNWLTRRDSAGTLVTRRYSANNLLLSETAYQAADTDGDNVSSAPMTTRYVYDNKNQLRYVVSAEGKVTEYVYDAQGLRQAQWQYNDRSFAIGADPALPLDEDALNAWAAGADRSKAQLQEYKYDARGALTATVSYTAIGADGKGSGAVMQSLVRDHAGQIIASYTGVAQTASFSYDQLGRVLTSSKDGSLTSYTYAANSTTATVTLAGASSPARSTTSTYDSGGRLLSVSETASDAADSKISNVYDKNGRLHSSTDANGVSTYWLYDEAGRVAVTVDSNRTGTRFIYNAKGQLVRTTISAVNNIPTNELLTPAGLQAAYGRIMPRATAYDRNTYASYDTAGRVLDTVDEEGYVSRRFYDGAGRLVRTTRYATPLTAAQLAQFETSTINPTASANDRSTYNVYDKDGRLAGTIDGEGFLTELGYDNDGNVVRNTRYAAAVRNVAADTLEGLGITANSAEDRVTRFSYGAGRRLLQQTDSDGGYQKFSYDEAGNVTAVERGVDRLSMARYDAQGRVTAELDGEGVQRLRQLAPGVSLETVWNTYAVRYFYNAGGQRTIMFDAAGNRTLYYYDGRGKLRFTVGPDGEVQENRYDKFGALTKTVQYAKRLGSMELGRLRGGDSQDLLALQPGLRDDKLDRATTFYYDDIGRLVFTVNAGGQVLGQQYNSFNQIGIKVAYSAALSGEKLARLNGGRGTVALAELAGFPNRDPNNVREASVYDIKGRLMFSVNALGEVQGRAYNEFGELKEVRRYSGLADIGRMEGTVDEAPRLAGMSLYSSVSYSYNKRGLQTDATDALKNHTLTSYNGFGEVTRRTRLATANSSATSAKDISLRTIYGQGGRVLATIDGVGALTYHRYDGNGNLIERTAFARLLTQASADAATAGNLEALSRALGDPAADQRQRFVYDANNRLVSTLTAQRYDAATQTTDWAVSTQRYDSRGNVVQRTSYGAPLRLSEAGTAQTGLPAADPADAISVYTYDALNRVVASAVLQYVHEGQRVWAISAQDYDRFGNVTQKIQYAQALWREELPADLRHIVPADPLRDRRSLYAYDALNRLTLSVDAEGAATQLSYDGKGNVVQSISYATATGLGDRIPADFVPTASSSDRITRFWYDAANRLVFTLDAQNGISEKRYDGAGNVQAMVRYAEQPVLARLTAASTTADLRAMLVKDAGDRYERHVYDLNGRLRFTIDAKGYFRETAYNALGQVSKTVLYEDSRPFGEKPVLGELEAEAARQSAPTVPEAKRPRIQSFEYDGQGNLLAATDAMQQTERYTYDALGRKTSFTNKLQAIWQYTYHAGGQLATELSPEVQVYGDAFNTAMGEWGAGSAARLLTRLDYDTLGNLQRREEGVPGAPGRVTEYRYDRVGRQIQTILPAAAVYSEGAAADASGRQETRVAGQIKVHYDMLGNAIANEDAAGKRSIRIYDKLGRLRFEQDALGYVTGHQRNAFGEVTLLTRYTEKQRSAWYEPAEGYEAGLLRNAASDRSVRTSYDLLGRAVKTTEALVAIYDQQMSTASVYAEAAKTTDTQYNGFGEVRRQSVYGADASGQCITDVLDTRYYYNLRGERTDQVAVLSSVPGAISGYLTRYEYDAAGNVVRQTEFSDPYAAWNEKTAGDVAARPKDRITSYTFNKNNNRLTETRVNVQVTQAVGNTQTDVTTALTTSTGYDALGRQTSVTDALQNTTFSYYDALGRTTAIARQLQGADAKLTEFKLDIFGNAVLSVEYANAAQGASTGAPPTPVGLTARENRVTATRYDLNGRAMEVLDAVRFAERQPGKAIRNSYDVLGRLVKQWRTVSNGTGAEETAYQLNSYDDLGRLTTVETPGNRDLLGQLATVAVVKTSIYNSFGEVISSRIRDNQGEREVSYKRYDRAGRIWLSNSDGGIHTVYLYDAHDQVTAQIRSTSTQRDELLGLENAMQALSLKNVQRTDKLYDALGHVIDVRNNTEAAVLRRENGSWVKVTAQEGNSQDSLLVLADAPRDGTMLSLRYRLQPNGPWTDASAERLQVLGGHVVLSTGGLASGTYAYELSMKPPGETAYLAVSGNLSVRALAAVAQHAQLLGLYLLLFNRAADPAGLNFWVERYNNGVTLGQIAGSMINDREALQNLPRDTTELVKKVLGDVFKRPPSDDPAYLAEVARWAGPLARAQGQVLPMGEVVAEMAQYYRPQMQKRIDALINYLVTGGGNDQDTANRLVSNAETSPDGAIGEGNQALEAERQRNQLVRMYIGLFGRVPDKTSFDARMAALAGGTTLESVVLDMLNSPEGQAALQPDGIALAPDAYNRRLVKLAYQNLAGRAPAAMEETWELGRLSQKTPDLSHSASLLALAARIAGSTPDNAQLSPARLALFNKVQLGLAYARTPVPVAEPAQLAAYYRLVLAGANGAPDVRAAAAADAATLKNQLNSALQFIEDTKNAATFTALDGQRSRLAQLYSVLLNRTPDQGGFEFWLRAVQNGTRWENVAYDMLNSEGSSEALYPATLSASQFVARLYKSAFNREVDAGLTNFWLQRFAPNQRAEMALAILDSVLTSSRPEDFAARDLLINKASVGVMHAIHLGGGDLANARQVNAMVTANNTSNAIQFAVAAKAQEIRDLASRLTEAANLVNSRTGSAQTLAQQVVDAADAANKALTAAKANPLALPMLRAAYLYVGLLNRGAEATPGLDVAGMASLAQQLRDGATDVAMAQSLLDSDEGQRRFPLPGYNAERYVRQLYAQMLNREPDAAALAAWSSAAANPDNRAQVAAGLLSAFLNDPLEDRNPVKQPNLQSRVDFYRRVGAALAGLSAPLASAADLANNAAKLSKELEAKQAAAKAARAAYDAALPQLAGHTKYLTEVSRLYVGLLNRDAAGPNPFDVGGLNFWTRARLEGISLDRVADNMLASSEGLKLFPPSQSNREFMSQLCQQLLGRQMQDSEQSWLNTLERGEHTRGWVANDMITSLLEGTAARESAYLARGRFEQRILDALKGCEQKAPAEIAAAQRDLDTKLAAKKAAEQGGSTAQAQRELDAANRLTLADFPEVEKSKEAIAPAQAVLASPNFSTLATMLVAFNQNPAYEDFAAMLRELDADRIKLADVLRPLVPSLNDRPAFFRELYLKILHREPEDGSAWWLKNDYTNHMTDPGQVAWAFYNGCLRELYLPPDNGNVRVEFKDEVTRAEAALRGRAEELTHSYERAVAAVSGQIAARRAQAQQAYDNAVRSVAEADLLWQRANSYLPVAKAAPAAIAAAIKTLGLAVTADNTMAAALGSAEQMAAIARELGLPPGATAAQFTALAAAVGGLKAALPLLDPLVATRGKLEQLDLERTQLALQMETDPVLTVRITELTRLFVMLTGKGPQLPELKTWLRALEAGTPLPQVADMLVTAKLGAANTDAFLRAIYQNSRDNLGTAADALQWRKALETQSRGQVALSYGRQLAIGNLGTDSKVYLRKLQTAMADLLPVLRKEIDSPDVQALLLANTTVARAAADAVTLPNYAGFSLNTKILLETHQLYAFILGREPTAEEMLAARDIHTTSRTMLAVVDRILASPEAQARLDVKASTKDYTTALFRVALGREADSAEFTKQFNIVNGVGKTKATYDMVMGVYAAQYQEIDKLTARAVLMERVDLGLAGAQQKLKQYADWLNTGFAIADGMAKDRGLLWASDQRVQPTLAESTFRADKRYPATITVDRWGNALTVADPRDANWKISYSYNHNNQLVSQSLNAVSGAANVPQVQTKYDALGRVLATIDAKGNRNRFSYDASGNVLEELHADDGLVSSAYDLFGNRTYLRRYSDTANKKFIQQNYAYDQLGHMLRSYTEASLRIIWLSNNKASWIDEGDRNKDVHEENRQLVESFKYDELGRKISSTDAAGVTSTIEYDLENNVIATMTAGRYRVVTRYDGMHNKRASLDANGMTMRWDVNDYGVIDKYSDLGNNVTEYSYDAAGQKLSMKITRPDGATGTTRYRHENGRLVEVYDDVAKMMTEYRYDVAGNRLSERQSYAADATRHPNRVQNNAMTYDLHNRLLTVKDDLYTLTYTYDLNGNRETVRTQIAGTGQDLTVYNSYDKMNRQLLVNGVSNTGNVDKDIGEKGHLLAYDQLGNRVRDSYKGKRASDGNVGTTVETFEYDGAGRLAAVKRDDWLVDQRDYDAVGRVSRSGMVDRPFLHRRDAIEKAGLNLQTRSYAYDVGGHVIRQNDRSWVGQDLDIFYVQDKNQPPGGYDAMGNLLGYVVVTEFSSQEDKGYYSINYDWFDGAKEKSTQLWQKWTTTVTNSALDVYGRRIASVTPEGKVSEFFYDADGHVQAKRITGNDPAFNLIVNGQVLGEEDKNPDNVMGSTYETASATALTAPPAVYRVLYDNESLEGIAQALWGERNLWYLIGDANNLDRNAKLKAGDALRIPTRANTVYNDSDSFKPYDASEQLGNTAPTMAPPTPKKKGGCGPIGGIVAFAIAVVATIYTAGAAASLIASSGATIGGSMAATFTAGIGVVTGTGTLVGAGGALVAGAIGGAMGSIASQAFGIATGMQDGFNWRGVAMSAVGGGMGAGLGRLAALAEPGSMAAALQGEGYAATVGRAVLSNAASQGINTMAGLQKGFDWRGVAASAAGAATSVAVGQALRGDNILAKIMAGNKLAQSTTVGFAAGTAAAIAHGGKIDVVRIATDAFGNALGNSLADTLSAERPTGVATSAGKRGFVENIDRQQRAFDALLKASGSETVAQQYMQQYADLIDDTSGILDFGGAAAASDPKYLVRPSDPEQVSAYDKVLLMAGKTPADAWLTAKDVAIRQRADSIELEISSVQRTDPRRAEALRDMHQELVFGLLNRDSYFQNEISELMPRGWGRVTAESDLRRFNLSSELLVDKEQGYFGVLYRNKNTESYVFANRGTDERIDWVHNFLQSVGKPSLQYERAIDIARRLQSSEIATKLTFTGHSLGGGLASAQSMVTGLSGITFNSAGLNPATVAPYGSNLMARARNIRAYYVQGELLSTMQDSGATVVAGAATWVGSPLLGAGSYAALSKLPKAAGLRIALDAAGDPVKMGNILAPGNTFTAISPITSLDLHGMSNVLNSLYRRIATTAQPGWFVKWN